MKKKILFVACVWLLCLGHALADEFVINDVTIPQGGTSSLTVGFNFTTTTDKVGFTFALGLPEGISLVKDADGDPVFEKDETSISKLNIAFADHGNGGIAGQPSNENATIKGTSGTLLTLQLSADASLAVGSTHTVNVTKATFQQRVNGSVNDINIPDFTFTVTIGEPDDGRIKFDENAAKLPTYTAGEKGDVRMKRTIYANQWSTIVLPFTLSKEKAEAAFGSDVQLAEFSGFEVEYENEDDVTPDAITINFTTYTMTTKKGMTGGKPFLIKTSADITGFEADDCTLVGAVTDVSKTDEYETNGIFTGTFVKTVVPDDGLFIYDEKFYYSTGKTDIKAFRGWFQLGAVLDKETNFGVKMAVFIDDEATDINAIDNGELTIDNSAIYNLAGQRVGKNYRGIVVTKGRKAVK